MCTWAIIGIQFCCCSYFVNSMSASQSVRCRQSGLFPGAHRKSGRTGFVSCCSLSPLSDLGWAIQ